MSAVLYVGQSRELHSRLDGTWRGWGRHRMWDTVLDAISGGYPSDDVCIYVWTTNADYVVGLGVYGEMELALKERFQVWDDREPGGAKNQDPLLSWVYREPDTVLSLQQAFQGAWKAPGAREWDGAGGCYAWACGDLEAFEAALEADRRWRWEAMPSLSGDLRDPTG